MNTTWLKKPALHDVCSFVATVSMVAIIFLMSCDYALASSSTTSGLPWETPLQAVANSLKGPVAFAISLLGIVVAGATLIWGGEISEFVRRIVMLVLVISLLAFSASFLEDLFGTAAVVL